MAIEHSFLVGHGKSLVQHINHEEYEYKGKVYVCDWISPCELVGEKGGWYTRLKPSPDCPDGD